MNDRDRIAWMQDFLTRWDEAHPDNRYGPWAGWPWFLWMFKVWFR